MEVQSVSPKKTLRLKLLPDKDSLKLLDKELYVTPTYIMRLEADEENLGTGFMCALIITP